MGDSYFEGPEMPDDQEQRRMEIDREQNKIAKTGLFIQLLAIGASLAAAFFAASANERAMNVQIELDDIKLNLEQGEAQLQLLNSSLNYMERMVTAKEPKDRKRACFVAMQMGLIEVKTTGTRNIVNLHARFLENDPFQGVDDAPDLCDSRVSELAATPADESIVLPTTVMESVSSPPVADGLASQVVVLASYKDYNCKVGFVALDNLRQSFKDRSLSVAFLRSRHYAVVFSPNEDIGVSEFVVEARSAGAKARDRVQNDPINASEIERQNLQFTVDAYVANTEGWSAVSDCA